MRTTITMLSMLLLTGGLYASDINAAQNPGCDCVSACGRDFYACSADALVTQRQDKLACRLQNAQERNTCAVEYNEDVAECTGCGPDFSACAHKCIDDRTACLAPLHSDLTDCLEAATVDYHSAKQGCKAEQKDCVEGCK